MASIKRRRVGTLILMIKYSLQGMKALSAVYQFVQFYRIVGLPPVFTKQALLNRQNPKIYDAFANILGEKV